MIDDIDIAPEVVQRLGDDGLVEVIAYLWAVDCQTCGRSLAGAPPAVHVADMDSENAIATLHHRSCRRSAWAPRAAIPPGEFLSYRTQSLLLDDGYLRRDRTGTSLPTMIVNPSLEVLGLERSTTGAWRASTNRRRYLGMRPPEEADVDRALTAGRSRVSGSTVDASLGRSTWTAPSTAGFNAAVHASSGLLLLITPAFGPGALESLEPGRFFRLDRCEVGWVRLEGAARRPARPGR